MKIITTSSSRAYRTCARLYKHRYVDLYSLIDKPEALRFGTLVHLGLNAWWSKAPMEEILATLAAHALDEFEAVKAQELLRGYDIRWLDSPEREFVQEVEKEFSVPIKNPDTGHAMHGFRLNGKVDVRLFSLIVEHKTSSADISPGSPYWRRLVLDTQVSNYLIAEGVTECMYDVIGKPKVKPFKATPEEKRKYKADGKLWKSQHESDEEPEAYRERLRAHIADNPDKYYQRGTVVRLEHELLEAQHDLYQQAHMIKGSMQTSRYPRNSDSCMMYNRECEFFDACTGVSDPSNDARFMKKGAQHEELS